MVRTKRLMVFRCGHAMTTYAGAVGGCTVRFYRLSLSRMLFLPFRPREAAAVGVSTTLGP